MEMDWRHTIPSCKPLERIGAVALCLIAGMNTAIGADLEYQIRAAFILNFARYIEWPDRNERETTGAANSLSICVAGPDAFGAALSEAAANKVVNGRRVVIRKRVSTADASTCDMVYIWWDQTRRIRDALKALEAAATVTVGEDTGFMRMGGMIAFTESDGRIRFYVNENAAQRVGIRISSRLLALARTVHDDGERHR